MTMIKVQAKKWGNSLGIVLPSYVVEKEHIKENQKLNLLILKDSRKTLKETFGIGKNKMKKSTQQMMDEIRDDLYE